MTVLRVWAILILACAFIFALHNVTLAQNKTISWNEQGVLAYYKITGRKNDFEKKIKASDQFAELNKSKATAAAAQQYLEEELLRLQWGLGTFNPEKDFLKIKTKLQSSILKDGDKYYIASNFPGRSAINPPYFPYNMLGVNVALMLHNIEKYMLIEISEEQKNRIAGYLPDTQDKHEIQLNIVYRVISGDKEPIMLDSIEQQMMLGDIAKFELILPVFHQSQDLTLWEYTADWYLSSDEQDLLKILEGR